MTDTIKMTPIIVIGAWSCDCIKECLRNGFDMILKKNSTYSAAMDLNQRYLVSRQANSWSRITCIKLITYQLSTNRPKFHLPYDCIVHCVTIDYVELHRISLETYNRQLSQGQVPAPDFAFTVASALTASTFSSATKRVLTWSLFAISRTKIPFCGLSFCLQIAETL